MPHRLHWDGSYNIRDLGGITNRDGAQVQVGRLIRADNLGHLTPSGQQMLVDYRIRTIIDVRSAHEAHTWPHAFSNHVSITTVNIPVGTGATAEAQHDLDKASNLFDWSRFALAHCSGAFGSILACMAYAPPGGILIHCHAGKDRTGITVALVLALANVDPHLIAEDYAASDRGLQPLYDQWLAEVVHDPEQYETRARELASHPETMLALLEHLDSHYGGAKRYVEMCAASGDMCNRVIQRLFLPI